MRGDTAGLTPWMLNALGELEEQLARRGITASVYSGKRSLAEQLKRLAQGHTTVTKSKHLEGRAADLLLYRGGRPAPRRDYTTAGEIWRKLGGTWGGHFKDPKLARAEYQHYEESSSTSTSSRGSSRTARVRRSSSPRSSARSRGRASSPSTKLKLLRLRSRGKR